MCGDCVLTPTQSLAGPNQDYRHACLLASSGLYRGTRHGRQAEPEMEASMILHFGHATLMDHNGPSIILSRRSG